jgi:hypothetical protein
LFQYRCHQELLTAVASWSHCVSLHCMFSAVLTSCDVLCTVTLCTASALTCL